MFKEIAYWMYYFWNRNKRTRKDGTVVSNAMWTMAVMWLLNLMTLVILSELCGWDALASRFFALTDKVEWNKLNPVAYLWALVSLIPFLWISRRAYYQPLKLEAMKAKYGAMGKGRRLAGQWFFWLYVAASFGLFFTVVERKYSQNERTAIERLQEIRTRGKVTDEGGMKGISGLHEGESYRVCGEWRHADSGNDMG